MTYAQIKSSGTKVYECDNYGAGPYNDAYAGSTEVWLLPDNRVFVREYHSNATSYTGKTNTQYIGTTKDPRLLRISVNGLDERGYDPDTGADLYTALSVCCA